jgi:hypothetical protein
LKLKNHILTGILTGTLFPLVAYGFLLSIFDLLDSQDILYKHQLSSDFAERTLSLVALGCNVFPMQLFKKKNHYESMRGLAFPTMLFAIIWLVKFYDVLF